MLLGASPPLHIELFVRSEVGIDKRKEETRKKERKKYSRPRMRPGKRSRKKENV